MPVSKEEKLILRLLLAEHPRVIIAATPDDDLRRALLTIKQSGVAPEFTFPANLESLSREELQGFSHDLMGRLQDTTSMEDTGQSKARHTREFVEPDEYGKRRRRSEALPTAKPVTLSARQEGWLPLSEMLKQIGRSQSSKNMQAARMGFDMLITNPDRRFEIEGTLYPAHELFGFYQSPHNGVATYYINPVALPLIIQEFGWLPELPKDGVKRISLSEMVKRVSGNPNSVEWKARIKNLAEKLMENPDALFCPRPETGGTKPVREWMGYYYSKNRWADQGALYFHPDMEAYFFRELDAVPPVPEDRKHFVHEGRILELAHCKDNLGNRAILHGMIKELQAQSGVECGADAPLPPAECIGFYRAGRANTGLYHVHPGLLEHALSRENILKHREKIKELSERQQDEGWTRESGKPCAWPSEKRHWLTPSKVVRNLQIQSGTVKYGLGIVGVTQDIMREQYEAGSPNIGYFRVASHDPVYCINPEVLGVDITKEMIKERALNREDKYPRSPRSR